VRLNSLLYEAAGQMGSRSVNVCGVCLLLGLTGGEVVIVVVCEELLGIAESLRSILIFIIGIAVVLPLSMKS
jgi:hypothetical protein